MNIMSIILQLIRPMLSKIQKIRKIAHDIEVLPP